MISAAARVSQIFELIEQILLQLPRIEDIIRARQVCRAWEEIINNSAPLQRSCWYQPQIGEGHGSVSSKEQVYKLNPVFECLGVDWEWSKQFGDVEQDCGKMSLKERVHDQPGSWTTMLATQPPCKQMAVSCHSDYSDDEMLYVLTVLTRHWFPRYFWLT
jgi:hypothetical protein